MKSIYLVNPRSAPQAYFGAEVFEHAGFQGAQLIADLAITTVAACVPADFGLRLCDEQVGAVDLQSDADYIGITGKTSQAARLIELADAFRARGKVVLLGGPFVSLDPEAARPHADILVRGELEEIAAELFADLRQGRWREEYIGTRADLAHAPLPRWDLYPNHRALMGSVQTSRGCPFECEFCDVPAYVGRHQRHKAPAQVLRELDCLYALGHRNIFLADDNFTVYRQRARELLDALRWWNERQARQGQGPVAFATQVSIDAARDSDLLQRMGAAGFDAVFIGIETPSAAALRETRKRQNLGRDLPQEIACFIEQGIMVIGGMIVGFDADGPEIFDLQRDFIQASRMPVCSLGALIAPAQTPLQARLAAAGRLIPMATQTTATPWSTNIVPARLSREALLDGLQALARSVYAPQAYGERVSAMLERLGPYGGPAWQAGQRRPESHRRLAAESSVIIRNLPKTGEAERRMVTTVVRQAIRKGSHAIAMANPCLRFYAQVRSVYRSLGLHPA